MDILDSNKHLKDIPFGIPDGYFDSLEENVMSRAVSARTSGRRAEIRHIVMRVSAAAAVAAAIVLGSISVPKHIRSEKDKEQMENDSFFYTELMPVSGTADVLYGSDNSYIADTDLSDEDIIDYLIYSGIPVELLNESDYE